MRLWLEQSWLPEAGKDDNGAFLFKIYNPGPAPIRPLAFCYASMTRIPAGAPIEGARLDQRFGNHHRLEAAPGLEIAPGGVWQIHIGALSHQPKNRSQGAMAAWLEMPDGSTLELELGDLQGPGSDPVPEQDAEDSPAPPLALLPWPQKLDLYQIGPARQLRPGPGLDPAALFDVAALHRRLFPLAPGLLDLSHGCPVEARQEPGLSPEGFTLDFRRDAIALSHADSHGLRHGLIALAQILHAAQTDPRFAMPDEARIEDAPRFSWRGLHLDVARNFRPLGDVLRVIDIMAWLRLNRLHWHLTDDEGWRIEIPALPELTEIGARRGAGSLMPPQYADGPKGQAGFYSPAEARRVIAHAKALGIEVMPEIDMPGHMTALLAALPDLVDPGEVSDSYRSIQGYPNNALNPGLPAVYQTVETILDAICDIFPAPIIHLGGDEVDHLSWQQSPAALALARAEGLSGDQITPGLQALFMRRIQAMLAVRGRIMGGWDECAEGGGVDASGALLFAWRSPEKTAELMRLGYDVVATPGQAYYLDMVESADWGAIGSSWAGAVPARQCYEFQPAAGLPEDAPGRLVGVQAGIWSEHLNSVDRWNAMVFPRLPAIAEAGWSDEAGRDWSRFCAIAPLMPQL